MTLESDEVYVKIPKKTADLLESLSLFLRPKNNHPPTLAQMIQLSVRYLFTAAIMETFNRRLHYLTFKQAQQLIESEDHEDIEGLTSILDPAKRDLATEFLHNLKPE